jgi:hypothetical protein
MSAPCVSALPSIDRETPGTASYIRVVDEHPEAFLTAAAQHAGGSRLPAFVEQEFRDFLAPGVLESPTRWRSRIACIHAPSRMAGRSADPSISDTERAAASVRSFAKLHPKLHRNFTGCRCPVKMSS